MYTDFEALCSENEALKTQNEKLSKTQKDQDKLVQFLEKGITKRNAEYTTMTATFEEFLKGRLKQSKKKFEAPNLEPVIPPRILFDNKTILKAQIPSIGESQPPKIVKKHSTNQDQLDLDRGYSYLRKFKTLSRAFATGSFKYVSLHDEDSSLSSTRQNPLYLKLQAVESVREGKVYGEGKSDLDDLKKEARLPAVKSTPGGKLKKGDVLLYHGKDKKDGAPVAATRIEEMKVSGGHLKIGD